MSDFIIPESERKLVIETSAKHRTVAEPHADATLVESAGDLDQIQYCGYSHCPHCGIGLDNGLMDFDSLSDHMGGDKAAYAEQKHQWSCMGCNGAWGADIVVPTGKGRNAPLRHYTNKSTIDGAVNASHAIFDTMPEVRRKDAIQAAVDKGVAFYTARTQYQKWYKAKKASRAK